MKRIYAHSTSSLLTLGIQGEHRARQLVFDLSEWEETYGENGWAELVFQRPEDDRPYVMDLIREGSFAVMDVTDWHTMQCVGRGRCELRYYKGTTLVKSLVWATMVKPALERPVEYEPTSPELGWLERVLKTGANSSASAVDASRHAKKAAGSAYSAEQAAVAAKQSAEAAVEAAKCAPSIGSDGHWYIGDEDTGVLAQGPQGPRGPKGDPGTCNCDGPGGGTSFTTDETLTLSKDGVLSVNCATDVEEDNTLPITAAAVYTEVGNINILLQTI